MQSAVTVLTVCAGLVFSFACALLVEELIFGGLFRFMAARVPVADEAQKTRADARRFAKYGHTRTGNRE